MLKAKPVPLFFSARWFCLGGATVRKLIVLSMFLATLPLIKGEDYLTGFSVSAPLLGAGVFFALLLLLWLLRKVLLKIIVVSVVTLTFGGVGYLVGLMFLPDVAVFLGAVFLVLGLWISLKMLKMQGGNIVFVRSSLGSRDDESGFFDNDEWEWSDEG